MADSTSAPAGLTMTQATVGQQGNTPTQQAATDQAATVPVQPNFNSVNSTNLTPATPVNIPPPVQSPDNSGAILGGAQQTSKSVQDYVNQLTPTTQTPAEQQQQALLNQIAGLTSDGSGKDQALLDAQNASGATQDQADLTTLNNQLLTKTASYNQMQANLGGNNSVETSAVLAAQNAGLTKARAADIGITTAQIQAKQGDLTLAMNTAQQAVDAKYSTIEDNIKTSQAQLAAIQPMLSEDEKTQALAQQQVLQDQANAVAAQKETETQINNVALQAAQAGASPDVLAAIQNSTDVVSAIAAAAPALGAKVANDLKQQTFDNAIKLRTAANDSARVAIEQENANINLAKLQQDNNSAAQAALQAKVTTPSGKSYIDGTGLDAAAVAAAQNAGQIVLSGQSEQVMGGINNIQQGLGTLLTTLQSAGVDLSKATGSTTGFTHIWAAGSATPALRDFITSLTGTNTTGTDGLIASLSKLPDSGALVASLQNNLPKDTDPAATLQTKLTNIKSALDQAENSLLINNSQPAQITLNGKTLTLQADGTYQ
jgi:hypothetical protein